MYAYFFGVSWIIIAIYWSSQQAPGLGQWTFRILMVAGLISLIHKIIKRNYFEITDDKLVLNDNIFRKRTIPLDKIERIEIQTGTFTSSKIILKDETKISYSDNQTDDKELKKLMATFNISVE